MQNFEYDSNDFTSHFNNDFTPPQEFIGSAPDTNSTANSDDQTTGITSATSFSSNYNDQKSAHLQQGNDGKPKTKRTRATGEALAILKREFDVNPNPNAQNRKRISDMTNLPEKNVRIWFQNRRAKFRKSGRQNPRTSALDMNGIGSLSLTVDFDRIPLNINNNYYFLDVSSLTVGSWKRLKSGNLDKESLPNIKDLSNLSPISINDIMSNSTDLMVLISKKNFEINYFFSAIANNTKILFRIFFPINSVVNCSLSFEADSIRKENEDQDEQDQDPSEKTCELKLTVSKSPKFAVYFSDAVEHFTSNQWSICEDFSEGRQVSDAFVGGSNLPHVLNGLEDSLKFMNSLILDYNSTNQIIPPPTVTQPHAVSQQSMILQPEPRPAEQGQQQFFDDFDAQNAILGLPHQEHDQLTTQQFVSPNSAQSHHFTDDNNTVSQANLLPNLNQEAQVPNTPEFLRSTTDLTSEDHNGISDLLTFESQNPVGSSNANQNFF